MSATIETLVNREYQYGFVTDIEADTLPIGLVRSDGAPHLGKERGARVPAGLAAQSVPALANDAGAPLGERQVRPPIDYQAISYYSAPRNTKKLASLDEVDPELLRTYERLGISLTEQKRLSGVAVDAIFDSVSVGTTMKTELAKLGIIFCSFGEAVREHPDLVRTVPRVGRAVQRQLLRRAQRRRIQRRLVLLRAAWACNARWSCRRISASTAAETGQFERTLIIADKGASVSYLEGCTAPRRDTNQLHAAVVELVALEDASIKYSTVQNWYAGDAEGRGGIFNFVTKRGKAAGARSKISWTQVETGSAITWKYPSVILQGDDSTGEFYSVAVVNNRQQADTGTKMIHMGRNTKSTIISKGISAGHGNNSYRGQVKVLPRAAGARNYTQCDSMLIGNQCGAHTFPYIEVGNRTATVEHEASTSKIGEDQIFYCKQRGLNAEHAISLIVSGFCKEVFQNLPMEFALEAQQLLGITLEGSVG